MTIDLITATHADFEPFIGETFKIEREGSTVELVLDNIKIFKNPTLRDKHVEIDGVIYPPRHPFALTFEGPREPALESQSYRLSHEKAGQVELLVSAFRQDHDCMLYESILS